MALTDLEREITDGLAEARRNPMNVDAPMLGNSIVRLLSNKLGLNVSFVSFGWGEIRFNAGCVAYDLVYPPKAKNIKLHYRHMEALTWIDAKFDNRRANKAKSLIDLVIRFSVENRASPFEGMQ